MSEPFSVLPLATAAGAGRINDFEAQQLIAAGLTLLQRSSALVRSLAGRRSAILLPTSPAFITALAASDGRGAVLVNPLAAPLEISFQLRDADVGAVFTTEALAARVPENVTRVLLDDAPRSAQVVAQGVVRTVDLGSHVGLSLIGDTTAAGRDEEAAIVYTSALQGRPAGAILTHRNLLANARATREALELDAADHALAVLPYAHLFGLVVSGIGPLLAGGRVTTMERFNPIRAAELLESEGITQIVGVPAVFAALLSAIERRGGRLATEALRLCVCGGAPLAVELQDRWAEATGVELRQGYGLTEAGPVCLFNRVSLPNRRGTLGVPFPGVDVEIHHATTRELLREREEGEIWVRGANVSPGYVNGAAGLDCHGDWLRTGDLGVRNADGTFSFTGLLKPMFTRNGFNIYPAELATAILELPSVRDVRVRPIPDPTRENDIAIDVWGDVTRDEVKRWCELRLSVYKQPSEINVSVERGAWGVERGA